MSDQLRGPRIGLVTVPSVDVVAVNVLLTLRGAFSRTDC
jgi:hypothetical protein